MKNYDLFGQLIAYENGELEYEETLDLFQHLVDTGIVNKLQGHYGRTAWDLIQADLIQAPVPV